MAGSYNSPMALIRFDEVTLAFGDQVILQEADLAIEANERVCLIGRNGAGKSTTLKLISGELETAAKSSATATWL